MATTKVFIPDGRFCSDRYHLDCLFADHDMGLHWCSLYKESIGKLQTFRSNGEVRRAYRKCEKCLQSMEDDNGNGLKEDEEAITSES